MGAALGKKQVRSREDVQELLLVLIKRVQAIKTFSVAPPPVNPCETCSGTGIVVIERRMGPQMISKRQTPCTHCDGFRQPRDSWENLIVDFRGWTRNHTIDEVNLVRAEMDSMMDDANVIELTRFFQTLKV